MHAGSYLPPPSLYSERRSLLSRRRLFDQRRSLLRVVFLFESNDRGVSPAHYLRDEERQVDLRVRDRFGDRVPETGFVVALHEQCGDPRGRKPGGRCGRKLL